MTAMWLAAALVLCGDDICTFATGFACEVTPLQMEVWRGQRDVYLDPSSKNRAAVSRRLIHRVLVPLRSLETVVRDTEPFLQRQSANPGHPRVGFYERYCVFSFMGDLGDPEILVPAFEEQVSVYHQERERLGDDATPALRDGLALLEDQAAATLRSLQAKLVSQKRPRPALPLVPDLAEGLPACLIGYADRVRTILEQKKTRLERLDAALALRGVWEPDWNDPTLKGLIDRRQCESKTVDVRANRWAIQEITGPRDPREWDAIELAHLIGDVRELLHLAVQRPASFEEGGSLTFSDLFPALGRMGYFRARKLLAPVDRIDSSSEGGGGSEHFPREFDFYESEWDEKHPAVSPAAMERLCRFGIGWTEQHPLNERVEQVLQIGQGNGVRINSQYPLSEREQQLLLREWEQQHPGVSSPVIPAAVGRHPRSAANCFLPWTRRAQEEQPVQALTQDRDQKIVDQLMTDADARRAQHTQYARERWLETDRNAPHPDIDAVEAELKKLEAAQSSEKKSEEEGTK